MKIYLINGESYLLINEKINEIVGDSKNVTTFDLVASELQDVILEAGYFSMFEEEKFIIVKNANFFCGDKLKDSDTELLLNYLAQPNENSIIIFICNGKLDLRKKVTKIIKDKYSLISIPNLKYYEIENRVAEFLKKENFTIDKDTIKYIVANSLNNYDVAMSEVNKITLYYSEPCRISRKDVNNIVAKSINTNNFLFVDAIVDNDLEKSLELFNDLKIMKVEPTILISLIARDFRIMLNIKNLLAQNKREYEIMNELGLLDWQLEKYLNKIFPYKIKELENILLNLAKLDLDIKSGKVDRFIGLELFILNICG
ncbi:MAG: DNA polymerase III subunit delta [Firmicutes bacterium]|nr:DNA polymerase III subunit delta [Bacillota bacterium]